MNKNLFTKELKRNRKNLLIWTGIVIGLTLMVLAIFPFMAEMGGEMVSLMESMPPELSKAMGMDAETWSNVLGFYSTYYGIYIIVLVSIFTTSTGALIISKEEKDRTAEFLLTRPISRKEIFFSKIMSLLTLCLIIFFVQTIAAAVGISMVAVDEVNWAVFTKMHLSGLVLMLFFTTIGVLLSMFLQPKKNFMGIVVGLTFGTYFLNAVAKSTEATAWIGYLSPFNYLEITIDPNHNFQILNAIIMLAIGFGMLFLSYKVYAKKDIAG